MRTLFYYEETYKTDWSLIRSVVIRVINKIGRPGCGSPICFITSRVKDRNRRYEMMLPINHIHNKICNNFRLSFELNHVVLQELFVRSVKNKQRSSGRAMTRTVK